MILGVGGKIHNRGHHSYSFYIKGFTIGKVGCCIRKKESDIEVRVVKTHIYSHILCIDTGKRIGTEILYLFGNIYKIHNNHKYGSTYMYNYEQNQNLCYIKYCMLKGYKVLVL